METQAAAAPVIGGGEENHKPRERRCASARPPRGRRKQDYWRQQHGRCRSAPPPTERQRQLNKMDWTSEEHEVAKEFKRVAWEEVIKYTSMTDEEVVEEYRLAGKLHKYNPFSEMQKRFARAAKKYPPPDGYFPWVEEEFFRFIDDLDE